MLNSCANLQNNISTRRFREYVMQFNLTNQNKKLIQIGLIIFLFLFAFSIRFSGGTWEAHWGNAAYMARQAEYIYAHGHPAVPDPYSSAPLYYPAMAYLLALSGWIINNIPIHTAQTSMHFAEGLVPPLLGALTVLVIFWLGKNLYNFKAGFFAGLIATVCYYLVFRSVKGFVFHNALSLFLIVLTIAVTWKSLQVLRHKSANWTYLIAPAVLIALTGFAWGGYLIIHVILVGYALLFTAFAIVHKNADKDFSKSVLTKTWIYIIAILVVGTIINWLLYPVKGSNTMFLIAMQMLRLVDAPNAYNYIKNNTDPNAIFVSWWDYGNSLEYYAHRR